MRLYRESEPRPVIRRLVEQLNVHPEVLRAAHRHKDRPPPWRAAGEPDQISAKAVSRKRETAFAVARTPVPLPQLPRGRRRTSRSNRWHLTVITDHA